MFVFMGVRVSTCVRVCSRVCVLCLFVLDCICVWLTVCVCVFGLFV